MNTIHACYIARTRPPSTKRSWLARSGAFVNISSFAAVEPDLHFPVSAIIRAGLSAKLYVQQYGSRGLRMNNVLPGKIDTYPVSAEAVRQIPLARPGTADDVARLVAFLLSDDAVYIASQDLLVDGGLASARYVASVNCVHLTTKLSDRRRKRPV